MKSILYIFTLSLLIFSCDDNALQQPGVSADTKTDSTYSPTADYQNMVIQDKLEEIKIPDSIDVNLLIAMYDQELPTPARVVIHYKDTSRTTVLKKVFKDTRVDNEEELIKLTNNEFKSKIRDERYLVNSTYVYWTYTSGTVGSSYEYLRLDSPDKNLTD